MTRGRLPTDSTDICFHGPQELAPLWERFVTRYSEHGKYSLHARNAAMLAELAFGDGDTRRGMATARKHIEDAARALSRQTEDPSLYPLHKAIVSALAAHWVSLEEKHGLYPPPAIGASAGVTAQQTDAIKRREAALLGTPEGGLLAGTLRLAHGRILAVAASQVSRKYAPSIDYDDALGMAHDRFDRSLFRFRPDQNACFTTFVQGGLNAFLASDVRRALHRTDVMQSADDFVFDSRIDDRREPPPGAAMMAAEDMAQLRRVLYALTPRQRQVLTMRYGLDDGPTHTRKQVGERLGLSKASVSQIENAALARCRHSLSHTSPRSNPSGSAGRGR